jgi:formylmethanofuran dehydrogenase subunit E
VKIGEIMELRPIGIIHTPYKTAGDAPFQGRLSSETCEIEIFTEYEAGLKDIDRCTHLILLYWLDRADDRVLQTHTPHDPDIHGVFATRSPARPNPIGFHVAELIERKGNVLRIKGIDALDKTPLIDIKPYSSGIDAIGDANIGWFEKATEGDQTDGNSYRKSIEELIKKGDLRGLLEKTGELHGHFCSHSAYGVKAGYIAMRELGLTNTGMEEVVAIVETNNCFSDGIQMVTGCTFGNNSLIYKDYGKTAVTVAKRDGTAIRIALNPGYEESVAEKYPEANTLFEKLVVRREEPTPEENARMMQLFREIAIELLDADDSELFIIDRKTITLPKYAPIFASVKCSLCGENVMETRVRMKANKPVCIPCAGDEHYAMCGDGIHIER